MNTTIIRLRETDSTNNYLAQHASDYDNAADSSNATGGSNRCDDIVVVTAEHQTAGRGQGTNTWESEDGKNLLFSLMVKHTGIEADKQFVLSMAAALALRDAIGKRTEDTETSDTAGKAASDITLKWPNDIYWRDYKISGTLIETVISGKTVKQCIFGTGINVNQTRFISDAPNPTSLKLITGQDHSAESLLNDILQAFAAYYSMVRDKQYAAVAAMYRKALYRRYGMHPYRDKNGTFEAAIKDVALDGTLTLQTKDGELRKYLFKEVEFVRVKSEE